MIPMVPEEASCRLGIMLRVLIGLIYFLPLVLPLEIWPLSAHRMYAWSPPLDDLVAFTPCNDSISVWPNHMSLFHDNIAIAMSEDRKQDAQQVARSLLQSPIFPNESQRSDGKVCVRILRAEFKPAFARIEHEELW